MLKRMGMVMVLIFLARMVVGIYLQSTHQRCDYLQVEAWTLRVSCSKALHRVTPSRAGVSG